MKKFLEKVVKCHKCGDSRFTLYRVKDGDKLVKPAKYVCVKCK